MEFKCTCHNSGTNSFTGKCDRCGMTKPSQGVTISNSSEPYRTIHQNKSELEQFYIKAEKLNVTYLSDIFSIIEKLIKDNSDDSELGSKVRQLFSAEKELKTEKNNANRLHI